MLATKFVSHTSQFDSRKRERGEEKICLRHKIFDIVCHILHKIISWTTIMGYCSEVLWIHSTEGTSNRSSVIALTDDMFDKAFCFFFTSPLAEPFFREFAIVNTTSRSRTIRRPVSRSVSSIPLRD